LFGPAIFEASKLKVLFLGVDEGEGSSKHLHAHHPAPAPALLPRTYTLTHSDVTASLTLAVSHTINRAQLQGWYNRLQRDEVVAEWKKVRGRMSLHVHCHISGGHLLLDLIAGLRYYIFRKELPVVRTCTCVPVLLPPHAWKHVHEDAADCDLISPQGPCCVQIIRSFKSSVTGTADASYLAALLLVQVLEAFVHGDGDLFSRHPELEEATVWVYFHSNLARFNRVECWGPLRDAAAPAPAEDDSTAPAAASIAMEGQMPVGEWPHRCPQQCDCCFPPHSLIPWPNEQDMAAAAGQVRQQ
jgi:hypothetical protein